MEITYEKIGIEQKPLFFNVFEYYIYEFTPYLEGIELGNDGLYRFDKFDDFFTDSAYDPYLVRVDQNIAGFVVVKRIVENHLMLFTIDQFFIMKKYGRRGIGKAVAWRIFDQYRGKWRVNQKEKNNAAQAFWRSTIKEYTKDHYTERYNPLNRDSIQEFMSDPTPLTISVNEDITIKQLELDDAARLFNLLDQSRTHLRQWLPWVDHNTSVKDTTKFIRESAAEHVSHGSFTGGIWVSGEMVGCIALHTMDLSNRCTGLGYWLGERFQGKGTMISSVRALVDYAFYQRKLNRVYIRVAAENQKSRLIPERLGFRMEGRLRQNEWLYGHFVDQMVYSMLSEDWR